MRRGKMNNYDKTLLVLGIAGIFSFGGYIGSLTTHSTIIVPGCSYINPADPYQYEAANQSFQLPIPNLTVSKQFVPNNLSEVHQYADMVVANITYEFDNRYGKYLIPPQVEFVANDYAALKNITYNWYQNNTLNILIKDYWGLREDNETLWFRPFDLNQTLKHEFCHYAQEHVCRFAKGGESFCEIFSGKNNTCDTYLPEDAMYCQPFKYDEVNAQGFVDCVFENCTGYADNALLDRCYISHQK